MYGYDQAGKRRPLPVSASARKFFQPQPRLLVTNSTRNRPPSGRMLLETRKSSMDWMSPMPGTATPESTLNPSTHGMLSARMHKPLTRHAFLRGVPHWSMVKLMMFSNTAITVDSAAKVMNRKNSVPHSWPKGISLNTMGSVMNTRLGPEPGSTPNAKHDGKMTRPAMSATMVSSTATRSASPVMRCSLPI